MPSCAQWAREGEAEEVREATGIVQTREERKKKYSWLGTVAAILGLGAEVIIQRKKLQGFSHVA